LAGATVGLVLGYVTQSVWAPIAFETVKVVFGAAATYVATNICKAGFLTNADTKARGATKPDFEGFVNNTRDQFGDDYRRVFGPRFS
jgi:hypothetical protein